jgi:hypothetical protein
MSRLTAEAEGLVRAGRDALRPTDADRERVFQALLPQVGGVEGAGGADGLVQAPTAAKAMLVKISAVVVGLGVAGGGLFVALREESTPTAAPVTAPAEPPRVAPAPTGDAPADVPAVPEPPSVEKRAPAASRSADSLAQEVAILSRAGAELHAGRPATALKTLEEHQRKFPGGVLAQERTAARVRALCALGRTNEARAELARLTRTSPNSPHVARARKACGFDVAGEK